MKNVLYSHRCDIVLIEKREICPGQTSGHINLPGDIPTRMPNPLLFYQLPLGAKLSVKFSSNPFSYAYLTISSEYLCTKLLIGSHVTLLQSFHLVRNINWLLVLHL